MKKIFKTIIAALLVLAAICICAYASDEVILSDDMKSFSYDSNEYRIFNSSAIRADKWNSVYDISFKNNNSVSDAFVDFDEHYIVADVNLYFKDGSSYSANYLREDYFEEYNAILQGKKHQVTVDFEYPAFNSVSTSLNTLKQEKETFNLLLWTADYDYFPVTTETSDGRLTVCIGTLLCFDGDYYYIDHNEAGTIGYYSFMPEDFTEFEAYKITDKDELAKAISINR